MARYTLIGGPCSGLLSDNYTAAPTVGTQLICQSGIYRFAPSQQFLYAGQQSPAPPAPGGGGLNVPPVDARQVGKAWHRMTHVLAVEAPSAIRRSRAGRARIKRLVR